MAEEARGAGDGVAVGADATALGRGDDDEEVGGDDLVNSGKVLEQVGKRPRTFEDEAADARPGKGGVARSEIDELTERAKRYGASGLVWIALQPDGQVRSPIAKFLSPEAIEAIWTSTGGTQTAPEGDLILVVAGERVLSAEVLGRLRVEIALESNMADSEALAFCWVHRFPMYQWDAETGRWDATHNPFSAPVPEHVGLLATSSGDLSRRSTEDPAGGALAGFALPWLMVSLGWRSAALIAAASCVTVALLLQTVRARFDAPTPAKADAAEVAQLRWLMEELRVSLFAQELGTAEPVSAVKLERRIAELRAATGSSIPANTSPAAKPIVAAVARPAGPKSAPVKSLGALDRLLGQPRA